MEHLLTGTRSARLRLCCVALALATTASADGADARTRVFGNDYAAVERITLAPEQALGPHAGGHRIVYSLSDYTIDWTEDGKTERRDWREGEVHPHDASEQAVRNVGNTIADFLVVTRSGDALPARDAGADAAEVAGGYAALLGEFDGTRVLRVTLPPGARQPLHQGRPRVVYSLNGYRVAFRGRERPPGGGHARHG